MTTKYEALENVCRRFCSAMNDANGTPETEDEILYLQALHALAEAALAMPEDPTVKDSLLVVDEREQGKVFTYKKQPSDNVDAWRLGEACIRASKKPGGDYIDSGLSLLKELQEKGYGAIKLDARTALREGK